MICGICYHPKVRLYRKHQPACETYVCFNCDCLTCYEDFKNLKSWLNNCNKNWCIDKSSLIDYCMYLKQHHFSIRDISERLRLSTGTIHRWVS